MSYIITTTYPSSVGRIAAQYACNLASSLGIPVHLLHGYTVPVTFGDVPLPVISVDDILNITTERVNSSLAQLKAQYPAIQISSDISYGDFGDLLEEEASKKEPLMAVIGNDEELDSNVWIGSNASSLLREAPMPVLAVPQSSEIKTPQQVCLACDSKSINEGHPVDILLKLHATYNLRITVLHLLSNDEIPIIF
jgi:nucleotide-binding universal stress UspA family protein